MRKPLLVPALLALAAVLAAVYVWRTRLNAPKPLSDNVRYNVFVGTTPALPVRFEYPSDWGLKEGAGQIDRYAQVLIEGPRNSDGTFNPMLVVRSAPRSSAGGKYADAGHLMRDFMSNVYKDLKVLRRRSYQLSGATGYETEYTHTIPPLRLRGLKGRAIDVRTQHLFLERGNLLIEIVLFADRARFEACRPALSRLVATFSFTSD